MTTPLSPEGPNTDQIKHWNDVSGPIWVAQHELIMEQLRPLGELSMERAAFEAGERVLDVGCGCGETTLDIARRVGPSGFALGVDISAPMLERAREAARGEGLENVRFELADAQTASLPERSFEALYSRFGVMFFSDPDAAFSNLRRALCPGARLTFICWRAATENPWLLVPTMAIVQHIPFQPPDPTAPGPFAFADSGRVRGILERAGFREVAFEPVDKPLTVGGSTKKLEEAVAFIVRMGPTRDAFAKASDEARAAATRAVEEALAPYLTDEGVRMSSASWVVTAVAP
jgi:SAM-dependent methyltransferase